MGVIGLKVRQPYDHDLHYKGIKSKITTIKKHWPGNEKVIEAIANTYEGMVVNIGQKIAELNHIQKNVDEVIETTHNFFMQLLWEYDLDENVNFTTFLHDHLFYRVKNYYEKQNGTAAFLETCSSYMGDKKRFENMVNSGSNDDQVTADHKIRYVKDGSPSLSNKPADINQDSHPDKGLRRTMAVDMWRSILKRFDEYDVDMIICSELLKIKQRDIGKLFNKTQPKVCDACKSILHRMRSFVKSY